MSASIHRIHTERDVVPIIVGQAADQAKFIHQVVYDLENRFALSHKDACYISIAYMTTILTAFAEGLTQYDTSIRIIEHMKN